MTTFIVILVTVLVVIFIGYPFFKRRSPSTEAVDNGQLSELYSRRNTTYSMLKELEFDLQSDMLAEDEYKDLKKNYEQKAISILKDIHKLERGSSVEEEIEKQVLKLRQGKEQSCPKCGARYQEGARFCSQCGSDLNEKESS